MAEGWFDYKCSTNTGFRVSCREISDPAFIPPIQDFKDLAKDIQPLSFGQKSVGLKTTDSGDILSIKNFAAEMIDLLDLSKCKFKIPTEEGAIERTKKDEAIKKIIDGCLWAVSFLEMKQ